MYRVEKSATMQFARGCAPYLIVPFSLAILTLLIGQITGSMIAHTLSFISFFVSFGMLIFFRDPDLLMEDGIVSPANGKVTGIDSSGEKVVVKIFMNVWNIHVNRCPIKGKVLSVVHKEGGHIPAFDKDAEQNERVITDLETEIGVVKTVQIAGSVARRIVPYIRDGQHLEKGERIGIIRLGSRVDLHLPASKVNILVKLGDKVRPGQAVADVKMDPEGSDKDAGDGHLDPKDNGNTKEGEVNEGEKGKGQEETGEVERES